MVGGDAVALTVPELRRPPRGAGSDLLPSDIFGLTSAVRAIGFASLERIARTVF